LSVGRWNSKTSVGGGHLKGETSQKETTELKGLRKGGYLEENRQKKGLGRKRKKQSPQPN